MKAPPTCECGGSGRVPGVFRMAFTRPCPHGCARAGSSAAAAEVVDLFPQAPTTPGSDLVLETIRAQLPSGWTLEQLSDGRLRAHRRYRPHHGPTATFTEREPKDVLRLALEFEHRFGGTR